ncbi:MAG: hypothetical protein NW203_09045, partial [Hyphomonadaceae bacterium]|nr:hypothetical protein [Hyphomonadaceae bacterium]
MSNASPHEVPDAADASAEIESAPPPVRAARPGGAIAVLATVVGAAWIAAAALAAFVMIGPSGAVQVSAPVWALIGAGTVLPALMVWFAGAAAQEGARARHEAARLADAAERLLSPASSAEAGARKLAASVRIEISALDRALEHTIVKLREAQTLVQTQETAVGKIAAQAQTSASKMVSGLERERAELLQIAQDLNTHAEMISGSIAKHTKVIAEAAELAENEVKAADAVLDQKLSSFDAAAALIGDRTQALNAAAQASAESTLRLEQALSGALETLAKAGQLTDSARHSAEAASNAARATAGALQDTTARAIEDARRAAEIIRGEAASVERDATAALDRLRHAADGARHAAQDVRDAASGRSDPRAREPQRPADPAGYGWSAAAPRGRPAAAPEPPQDND